MASLDLQSVEVGTQLPVMDIPLSRTAIIAGAMATRDWQDVHHDHERAMAGGLKDIILSIPTTTGYVARFVTHWAGPRGVLKSSSIRLGASAYPCDTLRFTGEVVSKEPDGSVTVAFKAATGSAVHASGKVVLLLPTGNGGA